jgi:hypothetical protein
MVYQFTAMRQKPYKTLTLRVFFEPEWLLNAGHLGDS